jgi:hypothetical protein
MLMAEELALVAIDPDSRRHSLGTRDQLNACLAGLLIGELVLDSVATAGDSKRTIVLTNSSTTGLLGAVAEIVGEKGPKIKAVLSHMSRGLDQRIGLGTWDAVIAELVRNGVLVAEGGWRTRYQLTDLTARESIVDRLRNAAAGQEPLDPRTAMVLSMTGPAQLLEVVAPERRGRKHARQRIDHALDGSQLEPIGEVARQLLAEAAAAAATAASVAATAAVVS